MIKKTITYTDFNGNERTEEFHFHLTEADAVKLNFSQNTHSLKEHIEKIIKADNFSLLVKLFQEVILVAYGEKSEDGRRFIKTQEMRDEFSQTAAFSQLFMELATDAEAASDFMNGILPEKNKAKPQAVATPKKRGKAN